MIVSLLLGLAVFCYLLPACFLAKGSRQNELFGRIEIEQHARFQTSFGPVTRKWPGLKQLQENQELSLRLSRLLGLDRGKTAMILERLRWNLSMEEILLAKLLASVCLLVSLGFILFQTQMGKSVSILECSPILFAMFAFLFPTMLLDWADRRAKDEIRQQVPVFFSIVQALVEAGMPVHAAVKTTARRFDARLGHELCRLEVEEKRYGNWRKALEEMAYRWDVDALISVSMEIAEAMKKGVSIAGMLAVQIEEQLKQQEDEAAAYMNRLNVRLLPFVILFMGVPLLFLVMGPAFMGIKENL